MIRDPATPPRTALVCLENTHNRCNGAAIPLESMRGAVEVARAAGAAVHLDGARIFNAALALETDAATIAALADSVAFCFSKGLGAPVGSVLTGPREVIDRARPLRRQLGGAMRQAGLIAAAALYALEHHVERLGEDHERAARLAGGLAALPGDALAVASAETNIVFFEIDGRSRRRRVSRAPRRRGRALQRDRPAARAHGHAPRHRRRRHRRGRLGHRPRHRGDARRLSAVPSPPAPPPRGRGLG